MDSFPPGPYYVTGGIIKKTIVYIDGQNFLYKVFPKLIDAGLIRKTESITEIDIPHLLYSLFPNEKLEIRYYGTGKIKRQTAYGRDIEKKTIKFADALRRLKNYLKKSGVVFCAVGSLKVRDTDICKKCKLNSYKLQEKGVDVGLAVDFVADALMKKSKHAILISSDTDLLPAIQAVKAHSKVKVSFVGFSGEMVRAISALADDSFALEDAQILEAYSKANLTPEQRSARAKKAVEARIKKYGQKTGNAGCADISDR